jgi:pyridoxal biosynthesis lyase PdxS
MAEMLKGGVIMDVVTPDQAKIAEDAGAVAVMALERVPADIRAQGGVARMSDPDLIDGIKAAVSDPGDGARRASVTSLKRRFCNHWQWTTSMSQKC